MIPNSLRRLKILLGCELSETDHQVLITSIEHTTRHCKDLESVSIVANVHSWAGRAALVRRWKALPFVHYKERIIDPDQNSGIVTRSYKHGLQGERTSTLHISIPVDHVDEVTEVVIHWQIPPVAKLSLLPAISLLWSSSPLSAGLHIARLLQLLPDLRKISLPLELSSSLDYLLAFASSHHSLCAVELSEASVTHFPRAPLTNLIAGLRHYDHLRKLALPAYILCDDLCVCLGELQGLQSLMIMATSPIPVLSPAAQSAFPVLRTLKISCSKALSSDVSNAFLAFVLPNNSAISKVVLDATYFSHQEDMKDALSVIIQHREKITKLHLRIRGAHPSERRDWIDMSPFTLFPYLKELSITHPRPLALTDKDVESLIRAWPSAKFLSFNPRPILRPWFSSTSPSLNCLTILVNEGRNLRHFGVHLDPRPLYSGTCSSHTRLKELDLGEVVVGRKKTSRLRQLFPNARRL